MNKTYTPGPTLHAAHPIGIKVRLDTSVLADEPTGEIVGVSGGGLVWFYIVLLDNPIQLEGNNGPETHRAVSAPGSLIYPI